jgi:hypothetical protein
LTVVSSGIETLQEEGEKGWKEEKKEKEFRKEEKCQKLNQYQLNLVTII